MSMEKANLMLSEMKAANNRRRTFHFDSQTQIPSDIHQKPLFASASSITQQSQRHSLLQLPSHSAISPQASFSTPASPKANVNTRPLSLAHDPSSYHSLTHSFGQVGMNDALTKSNHMVKILGLTKRFFLSTFSI